MEYTIDYFIEKFQAIPEDLWTTEQFSDESGKCCALGHLGVGGGSSQRLTEEAKAFYRVTIFSGYLITDVNDGVDPMYQQHTPKQRVLAFLTDMKNKTNGSNIK